MHHFSNVNWIERSLDAEVENNNIPMGAFMGRVVMFEMSSQDPERATKFYSEVFGWHIGESNWGYHPVITGDSSSNGIDGGIALGPNDYPHGTRIQIEVEDIDDTINKSKRSGAQVVRDKMDFGQYYLAYLVDPVGIGIGLIQKK